MIFNQKLFWLLLPCSLTSLSTISFSSTESSNQIQSKTEDKELSIEEELAIISKIGSSSDFLDFGTGDTNSPKTLQDIVKNYLKTTSGAKELARRLTQHLIVNLIDNYEHGKSSAIKDKLRGKLINLRSTSTLSSLGAKEQKEARFLFAFDENSYQKDQVLQKSREIFEPVLNEVLSDLSFNQDTKFKKENDGDPLKILFSGFWDHVLDDYLNYERPIPFKKLTWHYDKSNRKEDILKLFDNPDSSIPEKASYHFPFVSQKSSKKFEGFLEKIKENSHEQKFESFSDENNIDLIVPISSLVNGEHTSQFTTSILEVFHYLALPIDKQEGYKESYKKSFLRNSKEQKEQECKNEANGIPEVYVEKITNTKDLFCIQNKSKGVSDFLYLIQNQNKPSWILFKDKDGIHALTYDSQVFSDNYYHSTKLKKHLIDNKSFGLRDKLNKYLNKHFERLILGYWDKFFVREKSKQNKQAQELSKLLLRDTFSRDLVTLRQVLLRDFLDDAAFGKKNSWERVFAVKFPYDLLEESNFQIRVKNPVYKSKENFRISYLERAFLLYPSKSAEILPVIDSFLPFKDAFDSYSKSIEHLFGQQQGQQKISGNFKFFKFATSTEQKKLGSLEIQNNDLFESVWASLRQDNKLAEILFKEKIKKDVVYFNFDNWSKISAIGNIDEFKFKDRKNSQNSENLVLNYLHSQYIDLTKDLSIPQILGYFDFEKINLDNGLKKHLEKIVKKFRSTFGSSSSDVSDGGVTTDLFAIKWLAENNFENFRKHLRKNLQRDTLSGFLFSKKFSEKDKCSPKTWNKSQISENLELKHTGQMSPSVFKDTKGEDLTCLISSDIVNFASVKIGGQDKYLTGYKGLVNTNWKDFFPEDIVNLLQNKTSLWKNTESLISYIEETVTSDSKYEELIKLLSNSFPNHNWDFSSRENCKNFNFDWNSGLRDSCLKTSVASFSEKKELLKIYLRQNPNLVISSSNSHNNWVTDKQGNHLIKGSDGAHHQIYFVQIKYDDVENPESWKKYLATIDSSYFFRELIKTAKDSKVKQQALLDGLTSGEGGLKGFKTGDDRLRRALGYSWLKSVRN